MSFRNLFVAILLGLAASLWVAAPASAEHAEKALGLADAGQMGHGDNEAEPGAELPGEAEELGHWALPRPVESFRTAAQPVHVDAPWCDPALPTPLRPPSRA